MGSTNTTPLNGCANCGGQLQYNFTYDTNKCQYCGSVFKIENAAQPYADDPYQATFVETNANTPEEPRVVYETVFDARPKPDIAKFMKAFLWGLVAWIGWFIVSLLIAGIIMAATNTDTMPNNLFSSKPFGLYWCLRGIIFCMVWPSLRANGFFKRKNSF